MFGEDPRQSKDLARIVSERHAQRLKALLDDKPGKVRQAAEGGRAVGPRRQSG